MIHTKTIIYVKSPQFNNWGVFHCTTSETGQLFFVFLMPSFFPASVSKHNLKFFKVSLCCFTFFKELGIA